MGASIADMENFTRDRSSVSGREDIEQHPGEILKEAERSDIVILTGGDPMVSTTHMDLRIRAARIGIKTEIIHGSSISSAACGLSGLQNYRFGKSCSSVPTRTGFR